GVPAPQPARETRGLGRSAGGDAAPQGRLGQGVMAEEARPRARATLLTMGRAVLVVAGVVPWLLPLTRALLPLGSAGAAIDLLFVPMCHRLPERTLSLLGVLMPLCSRCAGIFAGAAIGAAIARPRLSLPRWRWIIAATGALMALDVLTQDMG